MSETVIRVENLSKLYRLGELHKQTNSFREKVTNAFSRIAQSTKRKASNPVPSACPVESKEYSTGAQNAMPSAPCALQSSQSDDHLWALRDVSFQVKRGEVLGIIGRNGAGKSTLLKILSRITKPTEGKAWINGRVGSLLEVGTGFHQELTGRENIFLNGAILGMTKAEIKRKFDEIVDFAEIEKFIDTPVKRYSSGMYVRLAFAVAAHLEPEILLVDEVLSVGDAEFQKKCLGKMEGVAREGRTVLFVSHNMGIVSQLCKRCILFDQGKIKFENDSHLVIREYLTAGSHASNTIVDLSNFDRSGDGSAKILRAGLYGSDGSLCRRFSIQDPIIFELDAQYESNPIHYAHAIQIINSIGIPVYDLCDLNAIRLSPPNEDRTQRIRIEIDRIDLIPGTYYIHLWIGYLKGGPADFITNCLSFDIEQTSETDIKAIASNKGMVYKDAQWSFMPLGKC